MLLAGLLENTFDHDKVFISSGINVSGSSTIAIVDDTSNIVTSTIATSPTTTITTTHTTTAAHVCNSTVYDPVWDRMRCGCSEQQQTNSAATTTLEQKGASSNFIQQTNINQHHQPVNNIS